MYHHDLSFQERDRNLTLFRKGKFPILVCSRELGRGVDIPNVTHVISYEFAGNPYDHLHRIGRTARMGGGGEATTFSTEYDKPMVKVPALC